MKRLSNTEKGTLWALLVIAVGALLVHFGDADDSATKGAIVIFGFIAFLVFMSYSLPNDEDSK